MRVLSSGSVVATLLASTLLLTIPSSAQPTGSTRSDAGYSVGYDAANFVLGQLEADGVEVDIEALIDGFTDAALNRDPKLSPARMREVLGLIENSVRDRVARERFEEDPVFRAAAEANLQRSQSFHAAFGGEEGVTTLPSGVQFRIIRAGNGPRAAADAQVIVSFEGRLLDGFEFADSDRLAFMIAEANVGGREILTSMPVGSRWYVAIPPDKAFGLAGRSPDIGPNETLVFDVELHEIVQEP